MKDEIDILNEFEHVHSLFLQSRDITESKAIIMNAAKNTKFLMTEEQPTRLHFSYLLGSRHENINYRKKSTTTRENTKYPFFHVVTSLTRKSGGTQVQIFTKRMKSSSWHSIILLNGLLVHLLTAIILTILFYWFWNSDLSNITILGAFVLLLTIIALTYWKITEPFRIFAFGMKIPIIDFSRRIMTLHQASRQTKEKET